MMTTIEGGCSGSTGLRACGDHVAAETLRGNGFGISEPTLHNWVKMGLGDEGSGE